MGSQTSVPQWAFPKSEKLTQRLVPYSENKGYASNPRRFVLLKMLLKNSDSTDLLYIVRTYFYSTFYSSKNSEKKCNKHR